MRFQQPQLGHFILIVVTVTLLRLFLFKNRYRAHSRRPQGVQGIDTNASHRSYFSLCNPQKTVLNLFAGEEFDLSAAWTHVNVQGELQLAQLLKHFLIQSRFTQNTRHRTILKTNLNHKTSKLINVVFSISRFFGKFLSYVANQLSCSLERLHAE
jgi:hypothetical protein